jgi:hypothetical protein
MLLAFQSLERFKGVVEDVKLRPTEEEKKPSTCNTHVLTT